MRLTPTFLSNFITLFVHSKKEVATSQIHPNIWMTSFTFCQCQVLLKGNNNNHFNQGYYKNITLFSDRDYKIVKKNICSLSITVIQLFVTKRIHVVHYALIQCNLLCDTVYHKFFYCYVNKENASKLQLSSETLVTSSWKWVLMAVARTAH